MGLRDLLFRRPAVTRPPVDRTPAATTTPDPTTTPTTHDVPPTPTNVASRIHVDSPPPRRGVLTTTATIGGKQVATSVEDAKTLASWRGRDVYGVQVEPRLASVVAQAIPGVDRPMPHAGLETLPPPWNLGRLLDAPPWAKDAIAAYLDPAFIHRPADEKAGLLQVVGAFMHPAAAQKLARFHLPRTMHGTSTHAVITKAIESETFDLGAVYRYYAPDPSGRLDARALTPELRAQILDADSAFCLRTRTGIDTRVDDDTWLRSLRWKDLTPAGKAAFLASYQKTVDEKVVLHRITDPRVTRNGELAPSSLQKTLKWEREQRLQIAELITDGSYDSQDKLVADRAWIAKRFPESGFHCHTVAELVSPEDKKKIGPHITAFVVLQDLSLFASAAAAAPSNYTHAFLEPWHASDASDVAASFAKGAIDVDAIIAHKFHLTGMRTSIYGDDASRVGSEIRGVLPNNVAAFDHATERATDLLADGGIERLPAPPWPGWDAGDAGVCAKAEKEARKALGDDHAMVKAAQLSFDDVFELVDRGAKTKNGFAFRSPLWNYDAVPGLNDDDKKRIGAARARFSLDMIAVSAALSKAIEGGRDLDEVAPQIATYVIECAMKFHKEARVDLAIERVLDDAAAAGAP